MQQLKARKVAELAGAAFCGAALTALALAAAPATAQTGADGSPAAGAQCLSVELETVAAMTEDDAPAEAVVRQPGRREWALPLRAFSVSQQDAEGNALAVVLVYADCQPAGA